MALAKLPWQLGLTVNKHPPARPMGLGLFLGIRPQTGPPTTRPRMARSHQLGAHVLPVDAQARQTPSVVIPVRLLHLHLGGADHPAQGLTSGQPAGLADFRRIQTQQAQLARGASRLGLYPQRVAIRNLGDFCGVSLCSTRGYSYQYNSKTTPQSKLSVSTYQSKWGHVRPEVR